MGERPPSAADIGLTRKEVHQARQIRDAEKASPGVVRKTVDLVILNGVGFLRIPALISAVDSFNFPART
jgi:hypothetical protein